MTSSVWRKPFATDQLVSALRQLSDQYSFILKHRSKIRNCAEKCPADLCMWPDDRCSDLSSVCSCVASPPLYKLLEIKRNARLVWVQVTQPTGCRKAQAITHPLFVVTWRPWLVEQLQSSNNECMISSYFDSRIWFRDIELFWMWTRQLVAETWFHDASPQRCERW